MSEIISAKERTSAGYIMEFAEFQEFIRKKHELDLPAKGPNPVIQRMIERMDAEKMDYLERGNKYLSSLSSLPYNQSSKEKRFPKSMSKPKSTNSMRVLRHFRWLVTKQRREELETLMADLRRDRRAMRKENIPLKTVNWITFWQVLSSIVPIVWDGFLRFLAAILPMAKIVKGVKGLWG